MSIFPLRNTHYKSDMHFQKFSQWLQNHTNHPCILLGDFNMSTSDLQDKLSNSNLDNWFILPINGSPISWTRGSYSSDIDHALVNSSMLDKISSAYFVSLKILTKIVTDRISKYAFRNNFIRPEQFGFRNHEKCISLYISIREICQRRKFKGKFTYVAFLNLKKRPTTLFPFSTFLQKSFTLVSVINVLIPFQISILLLKLELVTLACYQMNFLFIVVLDKVARYHLFCLIYSLMIF